MILTRSIPTIQKHLLYRQCHTYSEIACGSIINCCDLVEALTKIGLTLIEDKIDILRNEDIIIDSSVHVVHIRSEESEIWHVAKERKDGMWKKLRHGKCGVEKRDMHISKGRGVGEASLRSNARHCLSWNRVRNKLVGVGGWSIF